MTRAARIFLPLLLLTLAACGAVGTVKGWIYGNPLPTSLSRITVGAEIGANGGNATMLDLVFVYDVAAVAQLPKTGPEWFDKKAALQKMLATGIDVVSLQVPAGAADFDAPLPARASKAIAVYAFANYIAEGGQPIANLTPWKQATIRLLPQTITYSGN